MAVAARVASGMADAGIGIEKTSRLIDVGFIPLIQESYDLVILKTNENQDLREFLLTTIRSSEFKSKIGAIGGYDLSNTGAILYETP